MNFPAMKKLLPLILLLAGAAAGRAATNAVAPAAPLFKLNTPVPRGTNTDTAPATEILSKSAYFDLKARTAIYLGDVRVKDPRMELACDTLTVKLSEENGAKYQSVIAETGVVIDFVDEKGQRIHGTGGKAIYTYNLTKTYTNDVMELLETPVLTTAQGTWRGDVITLDRVNNTIKATNSRMRIMQSPDITNSSILSPSK